MWKGLHTPLNSSTCCDLDRNIPHPLAYGLLQGKLGTRRKKGSQGIKGEVTTPMTRQTPSHQALVQDKDNTCFADAPMTRDLVYLAKDKLYEALASVPTTDLCVTTNDNAFLLAHAPTSSSRQQRETQLISHRRRSLAALRQRCSRVKPIEHSRFHQTGGCKPNPLTHRLRLIGPRRHQQKSRGNLTLVVGKWICKV